MRDCSHMGTPQAAPARFFVKELKGEEPVSRETAKELCEWAIGFAAVQPWNLLNEEQLVFVECRGLDEACVCSVMGALGQVFSLVVYLGVEGYQFFQKLLSVDEIAAGEFIAEQRSVSVEFVRLRELTRPDRELLTVLGRKPPRGLVPLFRASRPGYHPWYPTEGEARMLVECLMAMKVMCELLGKSGLPDLWANEDYFPRISPLGPPEGGVQQYSVQPVGAPRMQLTVPKMPALDERRIQEVLSRGAKGEQILEVDHFYVAGMIGGKSERKACMRLAVAMEARTGFAFPPHVAAPEVATGEMLVDVVLQSIETGGKIPREVHVSHPSHRILLTPLAEDLGFRVKLKPSLPALDTFKRMLQQHLGDPGAIPIG